MPGLARKAISTGPRLPAGEGTGRAGAPKSVRIPGRRERLGRERSPVAAITLRKACKVGTIMVVSSESGHPEQVREP